MQQGGGGGGGGTSEQVVEDALPISSRPPAANLEELMRFSADEGGCSGGGGGGASSGNRWPREETLALLRIRSEMDATFRDAAVKGPLWEEVSRKLGEIGYKRSAKKCREKFENVQKYYKRTKEAKSGRQDAKTYKFFTQLEALNTATGSAPSSAPPPHSAPMPSPSATLDVPPLSVGMFPPPNPIHISPPPPPGFQALGVTPSSYAHLSTAATNVAAATSFVSVPMTTPPPAAPAATSIGITFSSHSSSTASSSGYDDDEMEDIEPSNVAGTSSGSHKRKRWSFKGGDKSSGGGGGEMMEFFESLIRRVMKKQEAMQRSFLEALEKREQERLNREEAWRRQEMARLAREHELMAQERAASASRDDAIVSLIQKVTGQTIQLPRPVTISASTVLTPPPQAFQPQSAPARPALIITPTPPDPPFQQFHHQQSNTRSQVQAVMAIPEQQIPPPKPQQQEETGASGSSELPASSSRWPKAEVLALIDLKSRLESKYQDAIPKGPLWEEISGGMKRVGYNRSAKKCKEKWENINKYYKKVKESNKKRPEDAKTCPYFHQLDALYRHKVLSSSSSCFGIQDRPQQGQPSMHHPPDSSKADAKPTDETHKEAPASASETENRKGERVEESSPGSRRFEEGNQGAAKKPEGLVMEQRGMPPQQRLKEQQSLMVDDLVKINEPHCYNLDQAVEQDDGEDEELDEDGKSAYTIEFQQRDSTASSNKGSNGGAPSFLTMVK